METKLLQYFINRARYFDEKGIEQDAGMNEAAAGELAALVAENARLQDYGDEWQRACQEQMRQNEAMLRVVNAAKKVRANLPKIAGSSVSDVGRLFRAVDAYEKGWRQ